MKKILLIFLAISSFALAGIEDEYKSEIKKIESIDIDGTTNEMGAALCQKYDSYDKLLNKYYNKLMSVIDEKSKKALKESQKEWIKFRDKEDNFQKNILLEREGREWGLYYLEAKNKIIKDRVDELVDYLMTEEVFQE